MTQQRRGRLLVVTSSYPHGPQGIAGAFVRTGVAALARRGWGVAVVHPLRETLDPSADETGVARIPVSFGRGRAALGRTGLPEAFEERPVAAAVAAARMAWRLRDAARSAAPGHDAILSHWAVPSAWAAGGAARRLGIPHVCVLHSGDVHALRVLPGGRFLAARISARVDRFVAVSEFVRRSFVGLFRGRARAAVEAKTAVRGNPVADDAFRPLPRAARPTDVPLVLFLGRLVPVKGPDLLLAALRPGDPLRVVVAGDGPLRPSLEAQARARALPVEFAGEVQGAAKWSLLQQADLLVVPSRVLPGGRTEGLPTVIGEAFAARAAVVATDVGGVSELVRPGRTGWLVPPERPERLRQALLEAVASPRDAIERACATLAATMRADRWAQDVEAILGRDSA